MSKYILYIFNKPFYDFFIKTQKQIDNIVDEIIFQVLDKEIWALFYQKLYKITKFLN